MTRTRMLLALAAVQLLAAGAFAQSASEFGRASGGTIEAITKGPDRLSGSITFSQSTGARRGQGYEASLGGEIINDRLWFFGAGSILPQTRFSTAVPAAFDAKVTAQPVDWTNVTASFQKLTATDARYDGGTLPASFLSLRSSSILSDRMTLDFSFSHQTGARPAFGFPEPQ